MIFNLSGFLPYSIPGEGNWTEYKVSVTRGNRTLIEGTRDPQPKLQNIKRTH
jgi:hypothetical protein